MSELVQIVCQDTTATPSIRDTDPNLSHIFKKPHVPRKTPRDF